MLGLCTVRAVYVPSDESVLYVTTGNIREYEERELVGLMQWAVALLDLWQEAKDAVHERIPLQDVCANRAY